MKQQLSKSKIIQNNNSIIQIIQNNNSIIQIIQQKTEKNKMPSEYIK